MLRYLYGEDTYSINTAVTKIVADFVGGQKTDLNVNTLESAKLTLENFTDAVLSAPFLGDKKLTIVKNLIVEKENAELRKKIIETLQNVPASSDLIFVDAGKPDARDALYKYLQKNAECKYFGPTTELNLRQFITAKTAEQNIKIGSPALSKLTLFVGPDLWRLQNEILKLTAFISAGKRTEITVDDVELLVEPNIDLKIFDLTDALAAKNSKRAINLLDAFMKKNEDLMRVFNLVIYQIRNMLVIKDLLLRGEKNNIAKVAGLHPFVVQKTEQSLRKISAAELILFYQQLEEFDFAIKTSRIEIENALVLLFVNFCKNGKMGLSNKIAKSEL